MPLDVAAFDPEVAGQFTDPAYFDVLAQLRRDDPVHRYRDGSWVLTRYNDVRAVSRDPGRFSSAAGVLMDDLPRHGHRIEGSILHLDPPEHAPWRKLVARSFTPRAVGTMEPRVRELAASVLDRFGPGDEVDFVAELASAFPVDVIADLLGIPVDDREDFRRWSDACVEQPEGGRQEAMATMGELLGFLGAHVDDRRARPGGDLATDVATAEIDGCPISRGAAVMYLLALLVAGNETTRHLLSGTVAALSEHPDQRDRLAADPSGIALAVEEGLRWTTPIQQFGRTATEDVELHGRRIAAGDWVVISYASANRDESVFGPAADRFDTARPVPPTHLSFGFGEHLCLGASLARLEGRVFLEELLRRFPRTEVAGEPAWVHSTLVRGMRTLPVRLA